MSTAHVDLQFGWHLRLFQSDEQQCRIDGPITVVLGDCDGRRMRLPRHQMGKEHHPFANRAKPLSIHCYGRTIVAGGGALAGVHMANLFNHLGVRQMPPDR